MAILKVVEFQAESTKSFDDATNKAIVEAGKTGRTIRSVYITDSQANAADDKVTFYKVSTKVTLEGD
ncbi:MAG: dodecin family protein [Bacteroidia bacterium]